MNLFLFAAIASIAVILWVGIKSLKQQKQCFELKNIAVMRIIDNQGFYRGRKVTIEPISYYLPEGGKYKTFLVKVFLKKECGLSPLKRWLLTQRFGGFDPIKILDDSIVFGFPPWPKDPSDVHYAQRILDKISCIADELEKR